MKKTKYYLQAIIAMTFGVVLSACSLIGKVQDTSSEKIADLVVQYCAETNEYFRLQLREKINLKMAGQATIEVNCSPQTIGEVSYGNRPDIRSAESGWRHANLFHRVSFVETKRPIKAFRISDFRREARPIKSALTV